jgi:hypothetical protein
LHAVLMIEDGTHSNLAAALRVEHSFKDVLLFRTLENTLISSRTAC